MRSQAAFEEEEETEQQAGTCTAAAGEVQGGGAASDIKCECGVGALRRASACSSRMRRVLLQVCSTAGCNRIERVSAQQAAAGSQRWVSLGRQKRGGCGETIPSESCVATQRTAGMAERDSSQEIPVSCGPSKTLAAGGATSKQRADIHSHRVVLAVSLARAFCSVPAAQLPYTAMLFAAVNKLLRAHSCFCSRWVALFLSPLVLLQRTSLTRRTHAHHAERHERTCSSSRGWRNTFRRAATTNCSVCILERARRPVLLSCSIEDTPKFVCSCCFTLTALSRPVAASHICLAASAHFACFCCLLYSPSSLHLFIDRAPISRGSAGKTPALCICTPFLRCGIQRATWPCLAPDFASLLTACKILLADSCSSVHPPHS